MGLGIDLSTLLGAIIAGIIGIIAGILTALFNSKYEDLNFRSREHFKAHIKNLDLIKRVTSSILGEIFPPWKSGFEGTGTLWPGKHTSLNKQDQEEIKNNEIRGVSNFRFSEFNVMSEQNITAIDRPDSSLISDLANHFPDLSKKINQYEELIRTDGAKLLDDFYLLSDGIYDVLEKKGFKGTVIYGTAVGSLLSNSKDDLPVLTIARVVFNKSLNIPNEYWINFYRIYTGWQGRYPDYINELNDAANDLYSTEVAKEIRQLMKVIKQKKQEINEEIDRTAQITKLPNKCIYLK